MIYNPKLLIEELLRLNKKRQLYLKNKQSYLKNIDYIETQQNTIHKTGIHKTVKIPTLITQLSPQTEKKEFNINQNLMLKSSRNKKAKIFLNEMNCNTTREFYKENATPRNIPHINKGIINYKKHISKKRPKKESFSISNNKKHKETPYEARKSKQCLYKNIILTKQLLNTTSNLEGEVLRPYTSRNIRIKLSKSLDLCKTNTTNYSNNIMLTERNRKPQYYFNNLNLKKFETKNFKLLNVDTNNFRKKINKSYLLMTP